MILAMFISGGGGYLLAAGFLRKEPLVMACGALLVIFGVAIAP